MMQFVFSGTCRPDCARDRFHDGDCSDERDPTEADLLRAEVARLRVVAEAAANVVASYRGNISRQPHIGRLRDALAALREGDKS